ncbi:MAG: enolase C-terminal domain-like protein [Thiobacillus sp.]
MKITNLSLETLRIPFRTTFKHASAERSVTQSVLVSAHSDNGLTGYGEGCPRDYVTGETEASIAIFFEQFRDSIAACATDLPGLRQWSQSHQHDIDQNPAAWCTIELALLDLLARQHSQPVEALLGLPRLTGPFIYSAVLGATGAKQFAETLRRYQQLGIRDSKIKLSGNIDHDRENVALLRSTGISPAQVRADANNLWTDPGVAHAYLEALDYPFFAIEEPLQAGQFGSLASLAKSLSTRIILDESLTRESQIAQLPGTAEQWIVNLRVSKMGGLLRSLKVVDFCRQRGLSMIVGAQVGETSLLTRAALVVAQAARDILLAQEGAFGTLLLESDAFQPELVFGAKGGLDIQSSLGRASGWGLSPLPDLTERYLGSTTR